MRPTLLTTHEPDGSIAVCSLVVASAVTTAPLVRPDLEVEPAATTVHAFISGLGAGLVEIMEPLVGIDLGVASLF